MDGIQERFPGLSHPADAAQFIDNGYDDSVLSTYHHTQPLSPMDLGVTNGDDFDSFMYSNSYPQQGLSISIPLSNVLNQFGQQHSELHINTEGLSRHYESGGSATSTCTPPSFLLTPSQKPTVGVQQPIICINDSPISGPVGGPNSGAYLSPTKSPKSTSPLTPSMSPLSITERARIDDNPEDDDEAPEIILPHIENWKWVKMYADIATGTDIWVPQKVYQPYTEADRKRYIMECELKSTIYFFSSQPDEWGVTLEDALRFRLKNLKDKDDPMFEGCGPSVSIRIEWPGYRSWTKQIPTMDFKTPKGPITRSKLAKNIANCVRRFIEWAEKQCMEADSDRRWRVGKKYIKMEDLMLVSLHHVSKGSWQPQLRLRRALPELALHRARDGAASASMTL